MESEGERGREGGIACTGAAETQAQLALTAAAIAAATAQGKALDTRPSNGKNEEVGWGERARTSKGRARQVSM